jgi:predicted nucleic acid-binding protein
MNATEAFFDTNILLYAIGGDTIKAARAEELLRQGGAVSVQVLTEFTDVAQRKYRSAWPELLAVLDLVKELCVVTDVTLETHRRGLAISRRYGFRIYDSMIVAAAILAGCETLFSEDMQDGQTIESVKVRNPF